MLYKVTKQYARGTDLSVASFNEKRDAEIFVDAKLRDDARLKVDVKYRLFESMDLLEEFTQAKLNADGGSNVAQQGSQSRSSGQSFQPTPFNVAPRPSGMPPNWLKDDDKKEKDK